MTRLRNRVRFSLIGLINHLARSLYGQIARRQIPSNFSSQRVAALSQGLHSRPSLAGPRCSTLVHTRRVPYLRTTEILVSIVETTLPSAQGTLWGTTCMNCRSERGIAT